MIPEPTFDSACSAIESMLSGDVRRTIVQRLAAAGSLRSALTRLRDCMRTHAFEAGGPPILFDPFVRKFDSLCRQEGFHILHDWDGKAEKVNQDTIVVDVLSYVMEKRSADPLDRNVLAILLDYYLAYLLALIAMRAWDDGRPNEHLDRVSRLLDMLQGTRGSGQKFAEDAETLILVATSHYEPDDRSYDLFLDKTKMLDRSHRLRLARVHAASMGCHLRFGFDVTYGRDTGLMRDDNGVDYRWLCFALSTLLEEYVGLDGDAGHDAERDSLVEGILSALCADPKAFVGDRPRCLTPLEAERDEIGRRFHAHREELVAAFERHKPSERVYSPLSLFFNFAHNVVKGMLVDALLWGEPWHLTFNDLLTRAPVADGPRTSREVLAKTLMAYARSNPDRIRGRLMPVIVYDPMQGHRAFALAMRKIRECVV